MRASALQTRTAPPRSSTFATPAASRSSQNTRAAPIAGGRRSTACCRASPPATSSPSSGSTAWPDRRCTSSPSSSSWTAEAPASGRCATPSTPPARPGCSSPRFSAPWPSSNARSSESAPSTAWPPPLELGGCQATPACDLETRPAIAGLAAARSRAADRRALAQLGPHIDMILGARPNTAWSAIAERLELAGIAGWSPERLRRTMRRISERNDRTR